jgi:putative transposase
MILTYKLKHQFDLSDDLQKARQVAQFAIKNRFKLSSKEVSSIGLKSAISNQILRKYGKNKKCNSIKKVNLIVPNQAIKIENKIMRLIPLKLELDISKLPKFQKVNQVELSKSYAYVSVEVSESIALSPTGFVGLDRNATQHVAVRQFAVCLIRLRRNLRTPDALARGVYQTDQNKIHFCHIFYRS